MIVTLILSLYLAIVAAIKKRYFIVLLAITSMSVATLSFICNSPYFVQVAKVANLMNNIALIAFSAITIFATCRKE